MVGKRSSLAEEVAARIALAKQKSKSAAPAVIPNPIVAPASQPEIPTPSKKRRIEEPTLHAVETAPSVPDTPGDEQKEVVDHFELPIPILSVVKLPGPSLGREILKTFDSLNVVSPDMIDPVSISHKLATSAVQLLNTIVYLGSALPAKEAQRAAMTSELAGLSDSLQTKNEALAKVEAEFQALQKSFSNIQDEVVGLRTSMERLRDEKATLQDSVNKLEAEAGDAATYWTLRTRINMISTPVDRRASWDLEEDKAAFRSLYPNEVLDEPEVTSARESSPARAAEEEGAAGSKTD